MSELLESLGQNNPYPYISILIIIFLFRQPLITLILRIKSIDKSGVKIADPEAQKAMERKEAAQELIKEIGNSSVLREIEERITEDLEERELETTGDTIVVLIKHLAATRILAAFEEIYNFIFGSQITLLKKMNTVRYTGMSKQEAQSHFEDVQATHPKIFETWCLNTYLEFLISKGMILYNDERYHITDLGVEYLTWIVRVGRSENRAF